MSQQTTRISSLLLLSTSMVVLFLYCSESIDVDDQTDPAGSRISNSPYPPDTRINIPTPSGGNASGGNDCNTTGDYIDLVYPETISSCRLQNKLWYYWENRCSEIGRSTNYPCTWPGLTASPAGMIARSFFDQQKSHNHKLIDCGEALGGDVILFVYLTSEDLIRRKSCRFDDDLQVNIGCVRLFDTEQEAIDWSTLDNREQVRRCFNP